MNEAFARVKIDQPLKDAGWKLTGGRTTQTERQFAVLLRS